jgi:hypothetical protein
MKRRAFKPPATCSRCNGKPHLGDTLFHTGIVWLCATCLTNDLPGDDLMTKMTHRAFQADRDRALSKRARAANDIEEASTLDNAARWHHEAAMTVHAHGNRLAEQAVVVNGEVASGYMKDTLSDPDIAAIESSEARGRLLYQNDVVALGVDLSKTMNASNSAEKTISHQIAVAHKIAMQQAAWATTERDPKMEMRRIHASARMMTVAQEGMLTLQKLKATGPQSVTVQHVHVHDGGQAVVGTIDARRENS